MPLSSQAVREISLLRLTVFCNPYDPCVRGTKAQDRV